MLTGNFEDCSIYTDVMLLYRHRLLEFRCAFLVGLKLGTMCWTLELALKLENSLDNL